jgi:hypothetical protein
VRRGRASEWLTATDILRILDAAGLEIPGLRDGENLEDDRIWEKCRQQIGKRLGRCFTTDGGFGSEDLLGIDGLSIQREEGLDDQGRASKRYMVYRNGEAPAETPF